MARFEWVQPSLLGAAVGAIGIAVIGFTWGGWVTGGTAQARAETLAKSQMVAALTPFCVAQSQADPQLTERLTALKVASSYQRRELVIANGWATLPGATEANRDVADACQKSLTS
ncbi:hypothetical protein K32_26860 [Kaistia sp. 32K]|uniref:hypothetical protein n=1 Tax=Kaistia sp. 32K TaxID=2795690 RepID=UPI0019168043|nr:hypothetical protein [Kaistia sp. 32K]BCP54069.1 hypothetical protein K32_26860 [Kaistia sp. 32K]